MLRTLVAEADSDQEADVQPLGEMVDVDLPKPSDLAVEAVKAESPSEKPASPYPVDVQAFSYQPADGSEPILLPLNGFEQPDKLWHFDMAQLPALTQTWRWMDKANVPKAIQRRAQLLPDREYFHMFDEWFEAMNAYRKSGPKGTVTAGK